MAGLGFSAENLARLFVPLRYGRRVDPRGSVRFRHWRSYEERGVTGHRAFAWLAEEYRTVRFATEPLAQYRVTHAPDHRGLRELSEPRVFVTRYRSPQLPLLELRAEDWRLMFRLPGPAPRRRRHPAALVQLPLRAAEPRG